VGKKKLGGGADFLSVIVLFLLSNYGPVRHCAITVKQFATKRLLRRAADASDPSYGNETPILHYPLGEKPK
jgi:hypothetical protein